MSITLRIILIISSVIALIICFRKIEQEKLKISESIGWIVGSLLLIFMSIFSNVIEWISTKLGFMAPVNFVFLVFIGFLLMKIFSSNMKISQLNEKLKNIDHYLALKEYEEKNEKVEK